MIYWVCWGSARKILKEKKGDTQLLYVTAILAEPSQPFACFRDRFSSWVWGLVPVLWVVT